jgi:hypothetical protein
MHESPAAKSSQSRQAGHEEDARAEFFQLFFRGFQDAVQSSGGSSKDFYYLIAGQKIRLQFAGDSLVHELTRALEHLRIEIPKNEKPDLTICLWDSFSSGRRLPFFLYSFINNLYSPPTTRYERGERGEIFAMNSRRFRAALNGPQILTLLDFQEKTAFFWMPDCREMPDYERGAPLKTILHWHFAAASRQLIHAGAVGNSSGGVLLTGEGGSGKSTTALNSLNSSLSYASDDYVLVELDPRPVAYSLFNTAKVKTRKDLTRFPNLVSWATNDESVNFKNEKPMMFVSENAPEKLIKELPLKAIINPRFVAGENLKLTEISTHQAFEAIAVSTVRQLPHADNETLRMLRQLVKSVPNYSLVFGEDQRHISEIIEQLLARHA